MTISNTLQRSEMVPGTGSAGCRVLHVLDHSWPVLSGYSIRSRNLVEAQKSIGFRPAVVTSPLHEVDEPHASELQVAGVSYRRTPFSGTLAQKAIMRRWPLLRETAVIRLLKKRIDQVLDSEPFDVVHAHSPALCGVAAWLSARERRLPLVYEIRAFWEDGAVQQDRLRASSPRYWLMRQLEFFVAQRAAATVGIAQHILDEMGKRGIPQSRLFHVPNGVDAERFVALAPDVELAHALKLRDEPVLGFIGSLYRFEGVSWLITAVTELRRRGASFQVLIIGHGEEASQVRAKVSELRAEDYVRVLPPVSHDEVQKYYSLMDVMVYPRLSSAITEKVTPLKPLEAMAQQKAVLASRVGGMVELISDGHTGVLFTPGDVDDFCQRAHPLLTDTTRRKELGSRAREMVLKQKDWKIVAQRYRATYELAMGACAPAQRSGSHNR